MQRHRLGPPSSPTATTPVRTGSPRSPSPLGAIGVWAGFERADALIGLGIFDRDLRSGPRHRPPGHHRLIEPRAELPALERAILVHDPALQDLTPCPQPSAVCRSAGCCRQLVGLPSGGPLGSAITRVDDASSSEARHARLEPTARHAVTATVMWSRRCCATSPTFSAARSGSSSGTIRLNALAPASLSSASRSATCRGVPCGT